MLFDSDKHVNSFTWYIYGVGCVRPTGWYFAMSKSGAQYLTGTSCMHVRHDTHFDRYLAKGTFSDRYFDRYLC